MSDAGQASEGKGLVCPSCGCRHFYTRKTDALRDGRIRRYKACRHCGRTRTTYEAPADWTPPEPPPHFAPPIKKFPHDI